jgi:DNA-binding transcriptional regulator LsrR (DeoR family)
MIRNQARTVSNSALTRLLAQAAWMYYIDGLTQQEIGNLLDLSRVKVNRLLQQAREMGIVEIRINTPEPIHFGLEQELCRKYGLREALVVTEAEPGEPLYRALAQGVALWLTTNLRPDMTVGIGQGRTLSYIPQVFGPPQSIGCQFVEVVGGVGSAGGFTDYNITSRIAELTESKAAYLYAPTIVSSPEIREALLQEPPIAATLELARRADVVLQSVGPVDQSALLYLHGYLNDDDLEDLRARGAVGDMLGQFFDSQGEYVQHPICERAIAISLEDLRHIPRSVVVAGGPEKVKALRAAMRGKLLNTLITDSLTAVKLLKED